MADAKEVSTEEKKVYKLHESRFAQAEHKRNIWFVVPMQGTPFDEILKPEFWTHISRRLRPGDHIEVVPDENTYKAFLIVIDAGQNWAKVALDRKVELAPPASSAAGDANKEYEVSWRGPHAKFAVLRSSDNEIMEKGFSTRDEAARWIVTNATRMQAA